VDLKNFLASWSLRSDMVGRSARKMALAGLVAVGSVVSAGAVD